jgi:hypothetical protein
MGFLVSIAAWFGANPAALAGLMLTVGTGLGFLSGKVSGWFQCNRSVAQATEQARVQSLTRDLEISQEAHKLDKKLVVRLEKELVKARKAADEFANNSDCPLSKSDVKRLHNVR